MYPNWILSDENLWSRLWLAVMCEKLFNGDILGYLVNSLPLDWQIFFKLNTFTTMFEPPRIMQILNRMPSDAETRTICSGCWLSSGLGMQCWRISKSWNFVAQTTIECLILSVIRLARSKRMRLSRQLWELKIWQRATLEFMFVMQATNCQLIAKILKLSSKSFSCVHLHAYRTLLKGQMR